MSTINPTDPIFASIEAHRAAVVAWDDALERFDNSEEDWKTEEPGLAANAAFATLVAEPATTMPGLIAKMAYLRDLSESPQSWMIEDLLKPGALITSIAASLENIWEVLA